MKYKIGQKVILKDNLDTDGWDVSITKQYNKLKSKIVTVKHIETVANENYYNFEEIGALWIDEEIACIFKEKIKPITSRFDILDLYL